MVGGTAARTKSSAAGGGGSKKLPEITNDQGAGVPTTAAIPDNPAANTPRYVPPKSHMTRKSQEVIAVKKKAEMEPPSYSSSSWRKGTTSVLRNNSGNNEGDVIPDLVSPGEDSTVYDDGPDDGVEEAKITFGNLGSGSSSPLVSPHGGGVTASVRFDGGTREEEGVGIGSGPPHCFHSGDMHTSSLLDLENR